MASRTPMPTFLWPQPGRRRISRSLKSLSSGIVKSLALGSPHLVAGVFPTTVGPETRCIQFGVNRSLHDGVGKRGFPEASSSGQTTTCLPSCHWMVIALCPIWKPRSSTAKSRLGLERKQDLPELIRVSASSPLDCRHKELAPCVRIGGLDGGRTVELLLIRCDELLISRVREARLPKRAAIDELSLFSEPLMVLG